MDPRIRETSLKITILVLVFGATRAVSSFAISSELLRVTLAFSMFFTWGLASLWSLHRFSIRRVGTWLALGTTVVWFWSLLILFSPTDYAYGGFANSDAFFISAQIEKARWYWIPGDFTYRGLSSFYPPLFAQILGKLANLLHQEPQLVRKYGSLATYAVLPAIGFFFWRPVLGTRVALVCGLWVLSRSFEALFKPYEVLTFVVLPPVWIRLVRRGSLERREKLLWGIVVAALFTTYYYPFFVIALAIALRTVFRTLSNRHFGLGVERHVLEVLSLGAVFSSWYWVPLLRDALRFGFHGTQQNFFSENHLVLFGLDRSLTIGGLFLWGGAISLILNYPKTRTFGELRYFVFVAVSWYALTNVSAVCGFPMLGKRVVPMVEMLLVVAACISLEHLGRRLPVVIRGRRTLAVFIAALVSALAVLRDIPKDKHYQESRKAGRSTPFRDLDDRSLRGKTVLTTDPTILAVTPLFGFLSHKDHYSHPASRYQARIDFLRRLSGAKGKEFCRLLERNQFEQIDYIFVSAQNFETTVDDFPRAGTRVKIPVPPGLDSMPCLSRRKLAEGVLYQRVRRKG